MTEAGVWRRRRCYEAVLASVMMCGFVVPKAKAELAYGLGYVAEHSSNIARTPTNPKEEWTHSLIAGGAYRDIGPELASHILAQAQSNYYQNNTYEDQTLYYVDASMVWNISPRYFTWTVDDRLTQSVRDVRAPVTPDNQVNTNIFNTGPDVYLRLAPGNTFDLGARYGKMKYGTAGGDNDRYSGIARWLYDVNATSTVSLNYETLKVDYDDEIANINYFRTDEYVRMELRPAPSHFTVDAGITKIDRERGIDLDSPLFRLTWLYQVTGESYFGARVIREHEDAGTSLLASVTSATAPITSTPPPAVEAVTNTDIFYVRRSELFYGQAGSDWANRVQVFKNDFDYELSPQDRIERGGHAEIAHNPGGLIVTTAYADLIKTEYLNNVRNDTDKILGLRWLYRFSRSLSTGVEASKIWRASTDPTAEYTDRRVTFGLFYSSGPAYVPARR